MKTQCINPIILVVLICFALTTFVPPTAFAGPSAKAAPGPRQSPVFQHVPPGGHLVRHHNKEYFFHRGRCYRHGKNGYFMVAPPVGIITYSLPTAATTILIAGLTYYVVDNIFYRRVPSGYQVVEKPVQTTVVQTTRPTTVAAPSETGTSGTQVVVTAKVLNVRSGPGLSHPILTTTYMGNILIVQGTAPGWYYVHLPDNTYGWVMQQFVIIPGGGAQG